MKKWLGLENYDDLNIELIKKLDFDGFIIGDPFCTYRMFKYGDADLLWIIQDILKSGKAIIFQTPVYITDRNFKHVSEIISCLYEKYKVRKFLVQDIGLVEWITQKYPDCEIIWSHWGRNRNSMINHDFISFIKQLGICGIETNIKERISAISKAGLPVYAVYGNTTYNTLCRDCYNLYMLDCYDGLCQRECLNSEMYLVDKKIKMSIDGHLLGRKIQYPKDSDYYSFSIKYSENIMVYAHNCYDIPRVGEK